MRAPDDAVDELYGAPLDEFIARRDARARELRKEKRREEADAVKALRKPSLPAWALNQLVRRDRDEVDGLLAAGSALRQARGGDTLRDATHDERDAVERLAERAAGLLREAKQTVSDKTAAELRDTLHAAALDDEVRDLLDRGRLVEARQAIGLGGFGLGDAGAAEMPPERDERDERDGERVSGKGKSKGKAKAAKKAEREEADERAERRKRAKAAREALREAESGLRDRERELREAGRDVDARERDLKEAEAALAAAQRAADGARDAVEGAREDVERRRAEVNR